LPNEAALKYFIIISVQSLPLIS